MSSLMSTMNPSSPVDVAVPIAESDVDEDIWRDVVEEEEED